MCWWRVWVTAFGSQLQALKCGGKGRLGKSAACFWCAQSPVTQQAAGAALNQLQGRLRCTEETQRAAPAEHSVCKIQSALLYLHVLLCWSDLVCLYGHRRVGLGTELHFPNGSVSKLADLTRSVSSGRLALLGAEGSRAACAWFEEGVL